jgi:hypothetical protein
MGNPPLAPNDKPDLAADLIADLGIDPRFESILYRQE